MTPKELREMAENKALDIGTAWNALEAAAERIETLEADCASLKQRAGLAAIRRLENERDDALARLAQYEDRNPAYPADLGRRTSNAEAVPRRGSDVGTSPLLGVNGEER